VGLCEPQEVQQDLIVAFQYLKGPTGKIGKIFLAAPVAKGQGAMALN